MPHRPRDATSALYRRFLSTLARLPPATVGQITVERALRATMSDGTVLLADRWAPATPGASERAAPIVLIRTPYGRRQPPVGGLFAERGYQCVVQSCRGTFGSGGDWVPFRNERRDGHDTLRWIAAQPWFGGRVATFGPSYLGLIQWAICDDLPPFVRAMSPAVTAAFFRDAVVYPGGAFALETAMSWIHQLEHQEKPQAQVLLSMLSARRALRPALGTLPLSSADRRAVGRTVDFYQDWIAHDAPADPWWDEVDFRPVRAKAAPTVMQGGWYDAFLPDQIADFVALRNAGVDARITIGPWIHASARGLAASMRDSLAWFDEHLAPVADHAPKVAHRRDRVRLFVMGAQRWMDVDDWPPPATVERWFLQPGGRLSRDLPPASMPDRFVYDPADPTPSVGGPALDMVSAGPKPQERREARTDVLTYTTELLQTEVTVLGPVSMELHFRSSSSNTDVFVRLCVVSAKGRSRNVSDGILRLRPGDGAPDEEGVVHLTISMWPTAITYRSGERIRVQVSSGAHPMFVRNTGSGEELAAAVKLEVARQEVFHDSDRPSAILLPVGESPRATTSP